MIRELRWAKRCLPALTGADPTGEEDDETLLAQIDLLVVASWVRFSPSEDLAREPFRTIILRGARELGVKPWTKVAPTLDDLSAAALSPDLPTIAAAAPSAKVGEVKTAQTALALLQKVFVLPGSIRLDAVFRRSGRLCAEESRAAAQRDRPEEVGAACRRARPAQRRRRRADGGQRAAGRVLCPPAGSHLQEPTSLSMKWRSAVTPTSIAYAIFCAARSRVSTWGRSSIASRTCWG